MPFRNNFIAGEQVLAVDINDFANAIIQNEHNIFELVLQDYFQSLITPVNGLFFDGFSDTTKANNYGGSITAPASSGQANVTVSSVFGLSPNMEVDIFDTSNGNFETKIISSIASLTITFTTNLAFSYTTAGFVNRTSVNINTTAKTITIKSGLKKGIYRSLLQSFQQSMGFVALWIVRTLELRFNLSSAVSAGAFLVKIAGDQTTKFFSGDTIDISSANNLKRERRVLNASPTFASGETTLPFATALVNSYAVTDFTERVDVLPQTSLVDIGTNENFVSLVYKKTINFFNNSWNYIQNYNALVTGNWSGQNGWSGASSFNAFQIVTSPVFEGAKAGAMIIGRSDESLIKTLSPIITDAGVFHFAMQTNKTAGQIFQLLLSNGTNYEMDIKIDFTNIYINNGGVYDIIVAGFTANTWYEFDMSFNVSTKKYKISVNGGAYSADKSWILGTQAQIDRITLSSSSPNFSGATWGLDDFRTGTQLDVTSVEDEYNLVVNPSEEDLVVKLTLDRNITSVVVNAKRLGTVVNV